MFDAAPLSDQPESISAADLFATLPPEWPEDPLPEIRAAVRARGETVVVLDDDPTGTQTVHDVPVVTEWSEATLRAALAEGPPALYVLTNSRSLPRAAAEDCQRRIASALTAAARAAERLYVVVSRSDSTLRGHFPAETDALNAALGGFFDAVLLIPAFIAGGRYTIGDVHYVATDGALIPAARTAFARDAAFGYRASNLRAWVEEKTGGRVEAAAVASLSLDTIRAGGPAGVAAHLMALPPGSVCIVNAASERDLAVVAAGVVRAEARGRRYLYRTAASFVAPRAGLVPRPLLARADLGLRGTGGGLIVVGSYVPLSSTQVDALLGHGGVIFIALDAEALLSDHARAEAIARAAARANAALRVGDDAAIITSRRLISGPSAESSLAIGRRVSSGLVEVVRAVSARPRYVLAKGGITSSDVATAGLGVRRALALGQIAPGVPVWRLGPESRYPGLIYVIFPGNVGAPETLAEIVRALRGREG